MDKTGIRLFQELFKSIPKEALQDDNNTTEESTGRSGSGDAPQHEQEKVQRTPKGRSKSSKNRASKR